MIRIRSLTREDLPACTRLLMAVYNNEMWQCRWTDQTGTAYLTQIMEMPCFVGYAAEEDGELVGAALCREKIWWNNSELYVEELFVNPQHQRRGVGTKLMQTAEDYVLGKELAGITLTTNRYAFAPQFYHKLGYCDGEHQLGMYKVLPAGE